MEQHSIDGLEDSGETYLAQRFSRPERAPKKMTYEFTRDAGYLHQYYRLRDAMFISAWGLEQAAGKKDASDDASDIMVARQGLHCVAGARLTLSAPSHRMQLPMEKAGMELIALFPEMKLESRSYGEFSRLAMLPEFEGGTVLPELLRRIVKKAIAERADYIFNIAPQPVAETCRRAAQLFGVNWDIRADIALPGSEDYEGKMVLSVMDLTRHVPKLPAKSARREKQLVE